MLALTGPQRNRRYVASNTHGGVTYTAHETVLRLATEMLITRHAEKAAEVARGHADTAEALRDLLTADAWRDIAHRIEILQTPGARSTVGCCPRR
jgi:hypothetical protein